AINRQLERDKQADVYGLRAVMTADDNRLIIVLSAEARGFEGPQTLLLNFIHPTRNGEDQQFTLTRNAMGQYEIPLPSISTSIWRLQLGRDDWRLLKQVRWPLSGASVFEPPVY
ncbi:MAG: FixH family protein, partial [Pseudomonadota bacterium]